MASNPVLKVAKSGESITSADIRDFAFHSDYSMFKIHDIYNDTVTIDAGDSSGYVDINHTLDYVPVYLVYIKVGDNWELFPQGSRSYITDSKIRITYVLDDPYNQAIYTASHDFWEDSTDSYYIIAGKKIADGTGSAVRFANIVVPQGENIVSADFEYKNVTTTSGEDIEFKIYGIDEDDTDVFGDPMGRDKTTAFNDKTQSPNTDEFNFGDDWTTMAQEIIDREGWSSGNAMGFLFNDDGTPNEHVLVTEKADFTLNDVLLTITRSGTLSYDVRVVVFKDKIV